MAESTATQDDDLDDANGKYHGMFQNQYNGATTEDIADDADDADNHPGAGGGNTMEKMVAGLQEEYEDPANNKPDGVEPGKYSGLEKKRNEGATASEETEKYPGSHKIQNVGARLAAAKYAGN
jgi:hypothetical protein